MTSTRDQTPMTFVLIHGGWQGGWAWEKVVPMLEARGHTAFAPTLRGLEADDADRAGLTLTDLASALMSEIDDLELDDFVLVAHSAGGPVVQYVADRLAERVRHTVFMSGWVLDHGRSINDIRPAHLVEEARQKARQSPDGTVSMDPHRWATAFMQDATPEQLASVLARIVPSPIGWLEESLDIPRFFQLRLPASYIFLRHDLAAPKERFQQQAYRLHDPRIIECDGSHQAMLTKPAEVTEALIAAVAEQP
jgi:pimeloyl-ACP methyl ester carboxylesterase